ncbi:DUF3300 domain-containing protein [Caballeronia sp. GAFFF1]|uniref:DUF3300 domain-containing protein n=1 Tax=Caballeronia sp. GAFFF1 TaxID=2921779 RepID=UPI002028A4E8|nr:DUF3300 domain-containing protein [Caballeronia sp. GAFFF1]
MPKFINMLLVVSALACGTHALAQAPAASVPPPAAMSAADLDKLVGPVALYPDDLVAIILPASTYPVEVVQADRFLERRKTDKNLPVDERWQDSVKALLNYPEIVKKMSTDLDWTVALGEAVVADQNAVLQAVQRFRRQTQSVGNLKSDDKQTIVVEKEVIKIVPSNPEVIYVPQYNPSTVVVSSPTPVYTYAPAPYPVYYYPYAPGAAFATGMIWGAAITAAWNGGRYEANYNGGNNTININREQNANRADVQNNLSNRAANRSGSGATQQSSTWRSEKKPGQVSGTSGRSSMQRVGDAPSRGGGAGGTGGAGRTGLGAGGGTERASARTQPAMQNTPRAQGASNFQARGGDALSGYGSGQSARADSARGAASRQSMAGGQGGRSFQGGGGGFGGGGGGGFSGGGGRSFGGGRGGRR